MTRYASAMRVANAIRKERPLSDSELLQVAPSIFATEPFHDRSERYGFVSTIDQINRLRNEGFEAYAALQSRTRIPGKDGFTKTLIELRRPQDQNNPERFSINLLNDHAGGCSATAIAGFNVALCANGCIMGGSQIRDVKVRHTGRHAQDDFIEGVYSLVEQGVQAQEVIEDMKIVTLDAYERDAFGRAALALRWDGEPPVASQDVLRARRVEERSPTLWNTFNVVQEHLIRGGVSGRTRTNRRMTTRAVSGVSENVRLNRALWILADTMRQAKLGLLPE